MQPLIYNSLVSHCRGTIDGRARTGFTTLACRKAAQSVLDEVKKYESYLCCPLTRLGRILDPRIGNGSDMALDMKQTIRDILKEEYGLSSAEPTDGVSDEKTFDYLLSPGGHAMIRQIHCRPTKSMITSRSLKSRTALARTSFMAEDNRQYSVPNVEYSRSCYHNDNGLIGAARICVFRQWPFCFGKSSIA
jgi:hypothetical protein